VKLVSHFGLVLALIVGLALGVFGSRLGAGTATGGALAAAATDRGLTGEEAQAAMATFVAPGEHDDYLMFASGGHSGQIHVIGMPSMQLLKTIPVFTPDAWAGYGLGADWSEEILEQGTDPDKNETLRWGDAHHPALSETDGDYDGRWVYINDRANGRIAMVDLRDFKTKQILDLPNMQTSHGGVFATPNTEYVHISAKTPKPVWAEDGYAELADYEDEYRGMSAWIPVDQETGRMDLENSFQIELPPYNQDLADVGKGASDGWAFLNSYNVEMATGGILDGEPPLETGAIANDYDYLHIIDWHKAEEVVEAGKYVEHNGMRVITLDTAIEEGLLYFAPEPRNPHGVDVQPGGEYISVSGKLDPSAIVYSFDKIQQAIADEDFSGTDVYGVPVLNFDSVVEAQVELGGGPLHTQFDGNGYAYTSLFVESAIAKWALDDPAGGEEPWSLVDKIDVHYSVGHLAMAHGDTANPHGNWLVSLNKLSVDRHMPVGTLHPQNFQLIDVTGDEPQLLKDMPVGFGEPHYAQIIDRDIIQDNVWTTYPAGTDLLTMERSDHAIAAGEERIEEVDGELHVYMTAKRSHFLPDVIRAKQGQKVVIHLTSVEESPDITHGFAVPAYNVQASLDPGETVTMEFEATRAGSFGFYCTEFCSALHLEMQGWLLVEPAESTPRGGGLPPPRPSSSDGSSPPTLPQGAPPMRRTTLIPAVALAAALGLSACSGGGEATAAGDGDGDSSAGGVTVVATEFAFDPADFSLPADTDTDLTLQNDGVVEHDIVVEELDDEELVLANAGQSVTETVNLPAGTYTFYCSIPGHRAGGMEGALTVE
jgi:nitrous-oxide reductase